MKLKNYIIFSISTLMLAGCTSEDITNTPDDERLPLRLEATLSTSRPVTRAAGDQFDDDDDLLLEDDDEKLEKSNVVKVANSEKDLDIDNSIDEDLLLDDDMIVDGDISK